MELRNLFYFLACLHEQCVIMQTMLYLAGVPEVCLDQPTPPGSVSRRSQDGGRSCPHVLQHVQWQRRVMWNGKSISVVSEQCPHTYVGNNNYSLNMFYFHCFQWKFLFYTNYSWYYKDMT